MGMLGIVAMLVAVGIGAVGWNGFNFHFGHTTQHTKKKAIFILLSIILGFCSSFLIIISLSQQRIDGWTILFDYIFILSISHICAGIIFRLIDNMTSKYISNVIFASLSFVAVYWFTIANILQLK